ncbi:MAG: hypothetical protein OEW90_02375 [Betaproteobacteria bacterium]|nr:hypothetical protein [Betaproteobacteria bacterium]MDH5210469.1 hypothetical protein [Betaproteobacteria bacterium]
MRDARLCPKCGFLLRYEDPADASSSAARYILVDMLRWAALALFLAFLWAGAETRELYAALALAAFVAWIFLRPRQRASGAALLERRRYHCARCRRHFAARDLTDA